MLIPTTNHRNSMRRSSCYNRTSTFPDYILILPDGILDAFEIRRNRTMNGCFVLCTENGDIYDIKGSYMFILGYVKDNYLSPNEKRKPKRVKWVYDHLGRLWMSFRCRSDVVSDVVQIAGGIQKFDILLCDRSKHSDCISNKMESDLSLNIMT